MDLSSLLTQFKPLTLAGKRNLFSYDNEGRRYREDKGSGEGLREQAFVLFRFFADQVAAIGADPADIYMQARALYLGRHYRPAFHLLNDSKIVLRDLRFRYLAAKCLEELEWDQCLLMLGDAQVDEQGNITDTRDCSVMYLDKDGKDREINAKTNYPSDPLVYNELGVVAYHMKEYKRAVWWFEKTLLHIASSLSETWERLSSILLML